MAQQQLWLGISTETWAIVLATFCGPVAAILITRWRDMIREVRTRRYWIFRTLLATRRQVINVDHVTAVNLIEVDFYRVTKVESAWQAYKAHLSSGPRDRPMTPTEYTLWEENRNEMLARLLFSMSQCLGFTMSEIDLKNGGYAPDGWRYRDDRLGIIQDFAMKIAQGNAALPVTPIPPPLSAATSKPAAD